MIPDRHDYITDAYYGRMDEEFMRKTQSRISWVCEQVEGLSVLDIGCSQGIVPLLLGREGINVVGVDSDAQSLAFARKMVEQEPASVQKKIEFVENDFMTYDFQEIRFDTILMTEILEHLTNPKRFVEKASEMLRPGCHFVITVPFGINDFIDHKHTFYFSNLETLLSSRFVICDVKFFGEWIGIKAKRKVGNKRATSSYSKKVIGELESNFFNIERRLRDELVKVGVELERKKKNLLLLAEKHDRLQEALVSQDGVGIISEPVVFGPIEKTHQLNIHTQTIGSSLKVECNLLPEVTVEYAFYLLIDGEQKETSWYTLENKINFDLSSAGGVIEVIVFARDSDGRTLSRRVSVASAL